MKGQEDNGKQIPVNLTHWPSCSAYVLWVGTLVMRQSPPMSWSSAGRWCNNMLPKVPWDWDRVAVQVETEASNNWSLCMLKGSPDILTSLFWQCANKLLLHAPTRCVIVSGRSPQQNSDCWNSGVVSATNRQMNSFECSRLKGVGSKEPFLCGSIDRPCTSAFHPSNESMRVDGKSWCAALTRLRASFRILRDMCLEKQGNKTLVRLCQFGIHCSLTSSQGFDVMRLCRRSSWWRTNELQVSAGPIVSYSLSCIQQPCRTRSCSWGRDQEMETWGDWVIHVDAMFVDWFQSTSIWFAPCRTSDLPPQNSRLRKETRPIELRFVLCVVNVVGAAGSFRDHQACQEIAVMVKMLTKQPLSKHANDMVCRTLSHA